MKWIGSTAPSSPVGLKTHSIDTSSDQPLPVPTLFYCGRIPLSEHPVESNIRGAAIIDKNGCLALRNWRTKRSHTRACVRPSLFSFFLFFRSPGVTASRVSATSPRLAVTLWAFQDYGRQGDEMNRRISDERISLSEKNSQYSDRTDAVPQLKLGSARLELSAARTLSIWITREKFISSICISEILILQEQPLF